MNLTTKNFKLFTWLFSSIWSRKPIIISSTNIKNANMLLDDLLHFIPQYRHIILCGDVTRKYSTLRKKIDLSAIEDHVTLKNSILTSFEEEKNINGGEPLQLIGFDVQSAIFSEILKYLDRGWITSTTLSIEALQPFFPEYPFEIRKIDDCSIVFLKGRPKKSPIESNLIKKFLTRSDLAAQNLIQRKAGEIRYTAEVLVHEIERGKTFHQAEIQELLEIDAWNFSKCLEIIEVEFYLDIKRYVRHTSNKVKRIHNKILEQDGILYACSVRNDEIIGLKKSNESDVFPFRAMSEFSSYIKNFNSKYNIGEVNRLSIDLKRNTKLILLSYKNSNENESLIFGLFLKADTPIVTTIRVVERIIEAEMNV